MLPIAVHTATPAPHLSSRYVHIFSAEVVDALTAEGFRVAQASARGARTRDPLYAKHAIHFDLPGAPRIPHDEGAPRLLFVNSHDGSSKITCHAGVFRFVCENGLVIGSTYASEVARHSGEQARSFIDRIRRLAANTGPLFAQIEEWMGKELTEPETHELARGAAVLRFGDVNRFDPRQLLETRRGEDEGRTLWRVFNRVQENASRHQLVGFSADGRRLASRPLKGLDATMKFNADLWRFASEFA